MTAEAPATGPHSANGPVLHGIRVLELGAFIAGPFAGQLLADYGADVIKIEPPNDGDPMRQWGVVREGESLWWPTIARNKRSVALDLRQAEGRDMVRRLARNCDVVIENFRPGRLTEWGLDYATLSAENPRLVMAHISGFGQTGPNALQAGFGSIGEAVGGIRFTTGEPDRVPARCGVSLGDSLAALFAVVGVLGALVERGSSGVGQEVDVAIYEAVFALMESTLADYEHADVVRRRTGSVLPGVSPSNVYPTGDDAEILIAANADSVFGRLCDAMDEPELRDDPRYATHQARGEYMDVLDVHIAEWTRRFDADALLARLEDFSVPASRIFTAPDMLSDPHYQARDMILRVMSRTGLDIPAAGVVPRFSRSHRSTFDAGPPLGQHTREVLGALADVDDGEWDALLTAGTCSGPTG